MSHTAQAQAVRIADVGKLVRVSFGSTQVIGRLTGFNHAAEAESRYVGGWVARATGHVELHFDFGTITAPLHADLTVTDEQ